MSTELDIYNVTPDGVAVFTKDAANLVRNMLCPKATDVELAFFASWCRTRQLDPLGGHVHLVQRYNAAVGAKVAKPELSLYGMLLEAERTGKYEGRTDYEWCGEDGVWTDVWLKETPPVAARVGVYRTGAREPIRAVALWRHYAQKKDNGELFKMWGNFDARMLGKCALALALREALPAELAGIYASEEMHQASAHEVDAPELMTDRMVDVLHAVVLASTPATAEQARDKARGMPAESYPKAISGALSSLAARLKLDDDTVTELTDHALSDEATGDTMMHALEMLSATDVEVVA